MTQELLAAAVIRDVPDFPKPGIMFKDITPVLEHPDAFKQVVDLLTEGWKAMNARLERIEALERAGAVHAEGAARLRAHALRGDHLQTVPGMQRCDGFFAAMFTRG